MERSLPPRAINGISQEILPERVVNSLDARMADINLSS
jgi:hypothetical protein